MKQQSVTEYFHSYQEAVQWITELIPFGIKPGLKRMEYMMERLNHPHHRLKFIHVAGTNGKGSTCAYLTNILIKSGYSVGSFTSPYITKYTDRIQLSGEDIPEETLKIIVNQLKPIADELAGTELGAPTSFEITTTLALVFFARYAFPDFVVLETGLGGRLDCTNIVNPMISVITNIGHDHMDILGDTLEQVAEEKAGIIKSGVPVVSSVEQPELIELLERNAGSKQSKLYQLGNDFHVKLDDVRMNQLTFSFTGPFRTLNPLAVSLNGEHQVKNAAVALMALEVLRQYYAVIIDDENLIDGLMETRWPGRLEMVQENPRLLIDGAHNPEGAETLTKALSTIYQYEKLHFMMGMLSTKNHSDYLWHILPIVDTLIVSEPDFRKKMDADLLAELVERLRSSRAKPGLQVFIEADWKEALSKLKALTGQDDLAVVSGTLYLISDVRSWVLHHKTSEKGW
jgi:dihydrofolate synthase/folylpolyglutamate synthase